MNFTVILGGNGYGKTNLLNSIIWCLYGKEKQNGTIWKRLPLISMLTFEKMKKMDTDQVGVEIQMLDKDSSKIILRRSLNFQKMEDDKIKVISDSLTNSPDGSKFEILKEIEEKIEIVSNPNYFLSGLIPENFADYFFIDGEKLDNYTRNASGEKIRETIYRIFRFNEEMIENFRKKLEEETRVHFFELTWKKDAFTDIKINVDFTISVIIESGFEAIDVLAAGDRVILALSFMAALYNNLGYDIPVILDTPFSRIDREGRINIGKYLPTLLKGRQVILLLNEVEYTPEIRNQLPGIADKEYRITFSEGMGGSIARLI